MLGRYDAWLASRVFAPIVIWSCQRVGWTQWRFHWTGWMIASWLLLVAASGQHADAPTMNLLTIWATWRTYVAAVHPDRESRSVQGVCLFFAIGEPIHFAGHALYELGMTSGGFLIWGVHWDASCPAGLVALAAEYAATIKNIPPRSLRDRTRLGVAPSI